MIDLLLALTLPLVALGVLLARELFRAVVMFIAFGLLMALVWVRLQAPDLALAEAAIGAGLTGVLLLDALGHLRQPHPPGQPLRSLLPLLTILALVLAGALGLVLLGALLEPLQPSVNLPAEVALHIEASGVAHPVTAVLLAFRAWDTLLEVAVILVAVVVGLALRFSHDDAAAESRVSSPLLQGMLSWLLPLMLLVALYLLWIGSYRSGGAFQAAAVMAAMLVLLRLSGQQLPGQNHPLLLRAGLVGGLGTFLLLGSVQLLQGGAFLAWPEQLAGAFILLVETALTFSLALLLYALFEASPAPARKGHPPRTGDQPS
ncbi:DUF4040 domain-containing protein [Marinospirillum alkaliphilum]|uniref:Uncharacterized MnhB-related membrane protein n=1 Tax=Marinospirillum alkaliphilum DSM 21637 TaxID=1122209 RepID=A0A1K1YD52_9GAMM|nr:DUF4040 domain-containing protein [Marinospirillum alkaliphilum]SFX59921.1 Uncharacterized MnhB-related membrane protein [Marinospirillum alkaliphilum DSM 21637]